MKNIIKLKKEVRNIVLDAIPMVRKDGLLDLIGEGHENFDEIDDLLNEILCESVDRGYDAGFQTAVNLMQGKLDFLIES